MRNVAVGSKVLRRATSMAERYMDVTWCMDGGGLREERVHNEQSKAAGKGFLDGAENRAYAPIGEAATYALLYTEGQAWQRRGAESRAIRGM